MSASSLGNAAAPGKPPGPGHGSIPVQCRAIPGAGGQCWGARRAHPAALQGTCSDLGQCLGWWGQRGCAWSCTAPAWDSELDPAAPSRIVALTWRVCALSADDCKNIANIMKTLAHRGFIFKQTSKPF